MALAEKNQKEQLIAEFHAAQSDLMQLLTAKLGDRHDAEDVLHDLFIKLAEMKSESLTDISEPKNYLFKIAHNAAIDQLRKRTRLNNHFTEMTPEILDRQITPNRPDNLLESRQQAELLKAAIANMPGKRRQAFLLYKFRNLTRAEIADELELSVDAVEKHIVRALQDCRDQLKRGNA